MKKIFAGVTCDTAGTHVHLMRTISPTIRDVNGTSSNNPVKDY